MQLKDYQKTALEKVRKYLALVRKEADAGNVRHASEDMWRELALEFNLGRYDEKENGLGRDMPNFVLKIPTGGGKTFLAVKTVDIINEVFRKKRTGLVLWVVPTTSMFRQTVKALKDRNHPYRQHLDLASGGRTLILEKYQGKIDRADCIFGIETARAPITAYRHGKKTKFILISFLRLLKKKRKIRWKKYISLKQKEYIWPATPIQNIKNQFLSYVTSWSENLKLTNCRWG